MSLFSRSTIPLVAAAAFYIGVWLVDRGRRRKRAAMERADIEARRQADLAWLTAYLAKEHSLLTQAERDDLAGKLDAVQGIDAFRHQLDDLHRLRLICMIQSRELVCWLDEMSDEQRKLARELKWARHRKRQSDAQLQANARARAERLAANPVVDPSPERLRAREEARRVRRAAEALTKAREDAERDASLRKKGAAAKAAYRSGRLPS